MTNRNSEDSKRVKKFQNLHGFYDPDIVAIKYASLIMTLEHHLNEINQKVSLVFKSKSTFKNRIKLN